MLYIFYINFLILSSICYLNFVKIRLTKGSIKSVKQESAFCHGDFSRIRGRH